MGPGVLTEVLLGLLYVEDDGISGFELQDRLTAHKRLRSDQLLVALLQLERSGQVSVARGERLRFALTDSGRLRAHELAGGTAVHVRLLMVDLVGFVAFTAAHGDAAARDAAGRLAASAAGSVRLTGGEVVKGLGDGFLAWLPPAADPLPVLEELSARCVRPAGERWQLRAGSHVGHPIRHGGDLFGGDVNLVARLCEAAAPDQLVVSRPNGELAHEHLAIRGMADPVRVARMAIR